MTPAERALLLAVAKHAHLHIRDCGLHQRTALFQAIIAVEAEAAPARVWNDAAKKFDDKCSVCGSDPCECRSCMTCSSYLVMYDKCLYPRDGECLPTHKYWQPKPTEADVCPVCSGQGLCEPNPVRGETYDACPDCGGTGRKEKK